MIIEDANQPTSNQSSHDPSMQLLKDSGLFLCHELRTPLTSIQGALELLHTGQLGILSDEGQRVLTIAINNANRLTRLANAIANEAVAQNTVFSNDQVEQLQLENDLCQALEQWQFDLVYQPIVSMADQKILGFEALARWYHPSKGVISPTVFIPLAEQLGYIHSMGMRFLEQACNQLHTWQQEFASDAPLTMSVNFSTSQLLQPHLIQDIQQVLERTQIIPNSLKLEITESAFLEDPQTAIATLLQIKAMGIQLYVDDFGTGYSSLGRLQELPIDVLKIDRSFVQSKQWDISATIILLANKLGLDVIAEGVEIAEDLTALQALGCTKMQGYHFSKPLDSQEAAALMKSSIQIAKM